MMKMRSTTTRIKVLVLVPALLLSACMDDKEDLAQYVSRVKSEQKNRY